jgi:hypothetical protein
MEGGTECLVGTWKDVRWIASMLFQWDRMKKGQVRDQPDEVEWEKRRRDDGFIQKLIKIDSEAICCPQY